VLEQRVRLRSWLNRHGSRVDRGSLLVVVFSVLAGVGGGFALAGAVPAATLSSARAHRANPRSARGESAAAVRHRQPLTTEPIAGSAGEARATDIPGLEPRVRRSTNGHARQGAAIAPASTAGAAAPARLRVAAGPRPKEQSARGPAALSLSAFSCLQVARRGANAALAATYRAGKRPVPARCRSVGQAALSSRRVGSSVGWWRGETARVTRLRADSCTAAWWRCRCARASFVASAARRRWRGGASHTCGGVCGA
jgi:hypothetical protein